MKENMTISQDVVPSEKRAFYHISIARRTAFGMAIGGEANSPEQVEHNFEIGFLESKNAPVEITTGAF